MFFAQAACRCWISSPLPPGSCCGRLPAWWQGGLASPLGSCSPWACWHCSWRLRSAKPSCGWRRTLTSSPARCSSATRCPCCCAWKAWSPQVPSELQPLGRGPRYQWCIHHLDAPSASTDPCPHERNAKPDPTRPFGNQEVDVAHLGGEYAGPVAEPLLAALVAVGTDHG